MAGRQGGARRDLCVCGRVCMCVDGWIEGVGAWLGRFVGMPVHACVGVRVRAPVRLWVLVGASVSTREGAFVCVCVRARVYCVLMRVSVRVCVCKGKLGETEVGQ